MFNKQNNSLILQTPVSLHFDVALNEELMQNKESERTQTPWIVVTQNSENEIARSMQTKVISSASNIGCLDEEIDTETPANVRLSPKREKSKGEEERKLKMQGEERKLASVHTYTLNRNITELKKSKNQQALRTKLGVTSSQFRETKKLQGNNQTNVVSDSEGVFPPTVPHKTGTNLLSLPFCTKSIGALPRFTNAFYFKNNSSTAGKYEKSLTKSLEKPDKRVMERQRLWSSKHVFTDHHETNFTRLYISRPNSKSSLGKTTMQPLLQQELTNKQTNRITRKTSVNRKRLVSQPSRVFGALDLDTSFLKQQSPGVHAKSTCASPRQTKTREKVTN